MIKAFKISILVALNLFAISCEKEDIDKNVLEQEKKVESIDQKRLSISKISNSKITEKSFESEYKLVGSVDVSDSKNQISNNANGRNGFPSLLTAQSDWKPVTKVQFNKIGVNSYASAMNVLKQNNVITPYEYDKYQKVLYRFATLSFNSGKYDMFINNRPDEAAWYDIFENAHKKFGNQLTRMEYRYSNSAKPFYQDADKFDWITTEESYSITNKTNSPFTFGSDNITEFGEHSTTETWGFNASVTGTIEASTEMSIPFCARAEVKASISSTVGANYEKSVTKTRKFIYPPCTIPPGKTYLFVLKHKPLKAFVEYKVPVRLRGDLAIMSSNEAGSSAPAKIIKGYELNPFMNQPSRMVTIKTEEVYTHPYKIDFYEKR